MGSMASLITSITSVYSTIHSCADKTKRQSSALLAFVRGIHRRPGNSPRKWPVTRKMFPFDDVIMYTEIIFLSALIVFQLTCHWCLFLYVKLIQSLHSCMWKILIGRAWNHCLTQFFTVYWQQYASLGLYSLCGRTSYHKNSWSIEAAKFVFRIVQSL